MGGEIIVFLHIDLDPALSEELFFHGSLHAKNPILVDQVIRAQADLQPGTLTIGGQPFNLCVLKIFLKILSDFQFWKNVKKKFGHTCPPCPSVHKQI